jgi:hypothetical protein
MRRDDSVEFVNDDDVAHEVFSLYSHRLLDIRLAKRTGAASSMSWLRSRIMPSFIYFAGSTAGAMRVSIWLTRPTSGCPVLKGVLISKVLTADAGS